MARAPYARFLAMSAAFAGSNLAQGAVAFLTSVVVAGGLGLDDFGQWTFCLAWASTLTFLVDAGFGMLLTRDALQSESGIGRLVGAALAVRAVLFIPSAIIFYLLAPALAGPADSSSGLRLALLVAGAGIGYGALASVFRAWPHSLAAILGIEMTGALTQCAGAWWIVQDGGGIASLLLLTAAVQGAQLTAALFLWPMVAATGDRIEPPSRREALALARRAFPFALSGLIANAQIRLAPLLLGYLSSAAAVAAYGAAWRIGNLVRTLPHAALAGALPVLTDEVRRGAPHSLRSRVDDLMQWFAIVAAVVVAAGAAPILRLTYGAPFVAAAPTLMWIAIGLIPSLINSGRKVYLYASGRERTAVRWSGVALAVQAAACTALIPRFGAPGAAFALAFGEAVVWWPLRRCDADVVPLQPEPAVAAFHHGSAAVHRGPAAAPREAEQAPPLTN